MTRGLPLSSAPACRKLIVCADDFGLDVAVNEAVEAAHRGGFLTCASLMVAEAACDEAVVRAKRLPDLAVGLHLSLTSGTSVLPRSQIPDLVGQDGRFNENLALAGVRYFFFPHVRRQLAAEIRAQFEAFVKTGLVLDHVNVHQHFHLHPTVASLVLKIGRDYGVRAMRVPHEPVQVLRRAAPAENIFPPFYQPWVSMLGMRIRRSGLLVNDHVLGLRWSGAMTPERVERLLRHLPEGITELYLHPAVAQTPVLTKAAPGYQYVAEFDALMRKTNQDLLKSQGIHLTTYGALVAAGTP